MLYLIFLVPIVMAAEFPSDLQKCSHEDSECIKNFISDVIQNKPNGIPELGIPSFNPLDVKTIKIAYNEGSPLQTTIQYFNLKWHGFTTSKVSKVGVFSKDVNSNKIDFEFSSPAFQMIADYKINGQVLVLPIHGSGPCNMTLVNPTMNLRMTTKSVEKNGKIYAKIDKFKPDIKIEKLYQHYSHLFGDEALSESMNEFLNQNWETIFSELKPVILDTFGGVIKNIMNKAFAKVPYDELFLD